MISFVYGCTTTSSEIIKPKLDSRSKLVRYRDHGLINNVNGFSEDADDDRVRMLAGHILKVICCIDQEKWKEANEALHADKVAETCGFRIDSPIKVFDNVQDAIVYARGKAMWYKALNKVRLPQAAIGKKGTPEDRWKFPYEIPELASRIYPIWLEEWIHVFQSLVAEPVCHKAVEFEKSPKFKKDWDINEVDVFAIFSEMGWSEEMLNEMEGCYDERIAFSDFNRNKTSQNQVVKFCCNLR